MSRVVVVETDCGLVDVPSNEFVGVVIEATEVLPRSCTICLVELTDNRKMFVYGSAERIHQMFA